MKKKIISTLILISVLTVAASTGISAASVDLKANQPWVHSGSITNRQAYFTTKNAGSSQREVISTAQYKSGWSWYNETSRVVAIGESLPKTLTHDFEYAVEWRLELNPEGNSTTGCTASGQIYGQL